MKNEIKQITEPINEVKEILSTTTGNIIHVTFSAVSKIMDFIPKGYFLEIVKNNTEKIEKILDKKDLPDIVKNTFKKVKDITDDKSEFWEYFEKLSEREKNIERFKLMLFSIILLPGGSLIVAGILGNPAIIAILNLGFLLPKDYMPKPAGDFRDNIIDYTKEKYSKVKNYLGFNK